MHTIFLVCGMSGSGKDTLVSNVCGKLNLNQLKSYTTRPRRVNEGETHIFISPEEVKKYRSEMIAYTKIGSFEYFATKSQLYDSAVYVIDYLGIKWMLSQPIDLSDFRFVTIYINVPDKEREARALNNRHDEELTFYKRCFNENEQFTEMIFKKDFDYAITNLNFTKATQVLESIIKIESSN